MLACLLACLFVCLLAAGRFVTLMAGKLDGWMAGWAEGLAFSRIWVFFVFLPRLAADFAVDAIFARSCE